MTALNVAALGMHLRSTEVDVIAHNISNISTTGYKKQRLESEDLFYRMINRPGVTTAEGGNPVPAGIQIGMGARVASVYTVLEQGAPITTENPYDLYIEGKGYFQVDMPDGTIAYTRSGSLSVNGDGTLVTQEGYPISPAILIPPGVLAGGVAINSSGIVSVKFPGQVAPQEIGQIQLVDFPNSGGLERLGSSLLLETVSSGAPLISNPNENGLGTLLQGYKENSNVNPITELTSMITAQRGYELCSKVITACDEMMQAANRIKG